MTRDRVAIGAAVPGIALRIAQIAVIAAASVLLQPALFWQVLFIVIAIAGAVFPRSGLAWLALLVVPLALVLQDVSIWRTVVALLTVHLGHVLTTLCLVVPARSRISLATLKPTAWRFMGVQIVSQVAALSVLLAVSVVTSGAQNMAWLAPLGGGAVVLLAVLLLRRTR